VIEIETCDARDRLGKGHSLLNSQPLLSPTRVLDCPTTRLRFMYLTGSYFSPVKVLWRKSVKVSKACIAQLRLMCTLRGRLALQFSAFWKFVEGD